MHLERRDLRPDDVRIDVRCYAGICRSDIHQARDEWDQGVFPMTPGHELIGTVAEVGSEVADHAVGDTVGVGLLHRLLPGVRGVQGRRGAVLHQGRPRHGRPGARRGQDRRRARCRGQRAEPHGPKKDDGPEFGATHYDATEDESVFDDLAGTFDILVNTAGAGIPLDSFLGTLGRGG